MVTQASGYLCQSGGAHLPFEASGTIELGPRGPSRVGLTRGVRNLMRCNFLSDLVRHLTLECDFSIRIHKVLRLFGLFLMFLEVEPR